MTKTILLSALAMLAALQGAAQQPSYDIRVIVQPGMIIDGITITEQFTMGTFALNDRGDIAFIACRDDQESGFMCGVFTPDRLIFKTNDVIDGVIITDVDVRTLSITLDGTVRSTGKFVRYDPSGTPTEFSGAFLDDRLDLSGSDDDAKTLTISRLGAKFNRSGQILTYASLGKHGFVLLLATPTGR